MATTYAKVTVGGVDYLLETTPQPDQAIQETRAQILSAKAGLIAQAVVLNAQLSDIAAAISAKDVLIAECDALGVA